MQVDGGGKALIAKSAVCMLSSKNVCFISSPSNRQNHVAKKITLFRDVVHIWQILLPTKQTRCSPLLVEKVLGHYTKNSVLVLKKNLQKRPYFLHDRAHISLSHTQNIQVIALSQNLPLGVDIETIKPVKNVRQLASRFFHPNESHVINSSTTLSAETNFLRTWTQKEAFSKATQKKLLGVLKNWDSTIHLHTESYFPVKTIELDECYLSVCVETTNKNFPPIYFWQWLPQVDQAHNFAVME